MGFDKVEDDLRYLDLPGSALGNRTNASEAGESSGSFPAVTGEDLGHLVPGCFVQVGLGDASYWVESGLSEGNTISGMVHPELSGTLCIIDHDSCEIARFSRDQITALGCDRYCWC